MRVAGRRRPNPDRRQRAVSSRRSAVGVWPTCARTVRQRCAWSAKPSSAAAARLDLTGLEPIERPAHPYAVAVSGQRDPDLPAERAAQPVGRRAQVGRQRQTDPAPASRPSAPASARDRRPLGHGPRSHPGSGASSDSNARPARTRRRLPRQQPTVGEVEGGIDVDRGPLTTRERGPQRIGDVDRRAQVTAGRVREPLLAARQPDVAHRRVDVDQRALGRPSEPPTPHQHHRVARAELGR